MDLGISKLPLGGVKALALADREADHVDPLATTVIAQTGSQRGLSVRELQVLKNVAAGLTDKQVAKRLGISPKTVRNHLDQVFSKLGATNRVEAVINGLRVGLLSL